MDNLQDIIKSNIADTIAILDHHFRNTILAHYRTAENLKKDIAKIWKVDRQDNEALTKYKGLFPNCIDRLVQSPRVNGKRYRITKEVIKGISDHYRIVSKKDTSYKSGKEYHRRSYILITNKHIDEIMQDKTITLTSKQLLEDRYTKRQCKLIRSVIYGLKADDKEQEIPSAKDTDANGKETIQMMTDEIARLNNEIARLKAENEKLKSRLDGKSTSEPKAANPNYPDDDEIEWMDVQEQIRLKKERIENGYWILHTKAERCEIPNTLLNRYVDHYKLDAKRFHKMVFNGYTFAEHNTNAEIEDERFWKAIDWVENEAKQKKAS